MIALSDFVSPLFVRENSAAAWNCAVIDNSVVCAFGNLVDESVRKIVRAVLQSNITSNGDISGHEFVDLGLPGGLKWASCNIGASSPSDCGDYFAWGETDSKPDYSRSNSLTYNRQIGTVGGNRQFDAATDKWGGSWRLPSIEECEELINYCIWIFINNGNHNGYSVVGPNGNAIFLPAAGYRNGNVLIDSGLIGDYWSASSGADSQSANALSFHSDGTIATDELFRFRGRSIRPVSE